MPKVSVLMTNYNGEKFIEEAIESILNQTYTDFELIIIDDWSTDESWGIIQSLSHRDTRIHCYQNTKNLWISLTRNRLIDLAQWDYIAWLDSDDRARSDRIEKQVQFLKKHPNYGIVGSWMTLIDADGREMKIKQLPISDQDIRKQWYYRNSLNHPTLMMRKTCIQKTGYFDASLDVAEDYDFWVRAGTHTYLANIPEALTQYRIHTGNISIQKFQTTIQKTLLVRKKMKKLGYKMWVFWHIAYHITRCMQYMPPKLVMFLFYYFIRIFSIKNTQ